MTYQEIKLLLTCLSVLIYVIIIASVGISMAGSNRKGVKELRETTKNILKALTVLIPEEIEEVKYVRIEDTTEVMQETQGAGVVGETDRTESREGTS